MAYQIYLFAPERDLDPRKVLIVADTTAEVPTTALTMGSLLFDKTTKLLATWGGLGTGWQITGGTGGTVLPAGTMMAYGGLLAPTGWLLCDGTSYLRTLFPDLFIAIGTAYGAADGTHFNVPDLRQRFALGKGVAQNLGDTGGVFSHVHAGPAGHLNHAVTQPGNHAVTQPGAHSAHVFTQPSGHSAHAVTQPSAHVFTQPGGHSAHSVTQPSAHAALANHAHELPFIKLAGGTAVLKMLAQSVFGSGTSRAPESQSAAPTANTTAATVALSQAVTGGTPSAHAGTAVDAHSAHSGGSVDTHSGTAVDGHSAHAGGSVDAHSAHGGTAVDPHTGTAVDAHSAHGATGTGEPPFVTVQWIVKT